MALENRAQLFNKDPEKNHASLTYTQEKLMLLYRKTEKWDKCEEFLEQALKNYEKLSHKDSAFQEKLKYLKSYKEEIQNRKKEKIERTNFNSFVSSDKAKDYSLTEDLYLTKLENYIQMSTIDPDMFREDMGDVQIKLGDLYYDVRYYERAEEYYLKALENYKLLFEKQPDDNRAKLAWIQYSLMYVYVKDDAKTNQYDAMLDAALTNYEVLYQNDKKCQSQIVDLRNRKGRWLLQKGKTDEAMSHIESAYQLNPYKSAPYLAHAFNVKASEYARANKFAKAIETIDSAIALMPNTANFYDSKGEILIMKGDTQGALEMWRKVLELDTDFVQKTGNQSELYKQLKEKGLIK